MGLGWSRSVSRLCLPTAYTPSPTGKAYLSILETKNNEPLCWPLEGETLALVKRQLESAPFAGSYIFPGPRGGNARSSIRRHFKEVIKAAGLEWGHNRTGITFHTLRHTMASLARNNGLPKDEIQVLGNWKHHRMVDVYAKFSDETLRKAAAKMDRVAGGGLSQCVTVTPSEDPNAKTPQRKTATS